MMRKLANLVYLVPGRLKSPFNRIRKLRRDTAGRRTSVTNGEILLKFCFSSDLFETWGLDDICIMGYSAPF